MTKKTVKSFKADLNYYKNVAKTQHSAEVLKLELFDLIEEVKKERKHSYCWREEIPKKPCVFVAKQPSLVFEGIYDYTLYRLEYRKNESGKRYLAWVDVDNGFEVDNIKNLNFEEYLIIE